MSGGVVDAAQAPAKKRVALIVTNATVVTQDATRRILSPGALAIDGADIVGVDQSRAGGRTRGASTCGVDLPASSQAAFAVTTSRRESHRITYRSATREPRRNTAESAPPARGR